MIYLNNMNRKINCSCLNITSQYKIYFLLIIEFIFNVFINFCYFLFNLNYFNINYSQRKIFVYLHEHLLYFAPNIFSNTLNKIMNL